MNESLLKYLASPMGQYVYEIEKPIEFDKQAGGILKGRGSSRHFFGTFHQASTGIKYGKPDMSVIVNLSTSDPAFYLTGSGMTFSDFGVWNQNDGPVFQIAKPHRTIGTGQFLFENIHVNRGIGWAMGREGNIYEGNCDMSEWRRCVATNCSSGIRLNNNQSVGHLISNFMAVNVGTILDCPGGGNLTATDIHAIRCKRVLYMDRQSQAGRFVVQVWADQNNPDDFVLVEASDRAAGLVTMSGNLSRPASYDKLVKTSGRVKVETEQLRGVLNRPTAPVAAQATKGNWFTRLFIGDAVKDDVPQLAASFNTDVETGLRSITHDWHDEQGHVEQYDAGGDQ